jgi:hypothetical protein
VQRVQSAPETPAVTSGNCTENGNGPSAARASSRAPFLATLIVGLQTYNPDMARGWESKAVEAQMEAAAEESTNGKPQPTTEQLDHARRKTTLILSRTRVQQQLEASTNPRHRQMLEAALADLETKIRQIP